MTEKRGILEKAERMAAQCDALTIAYIREDGYPRASTISPIKVDGLRTIYLSTTMQCLKTKRILANPKASLCIRGAQGNITLTGKIVVSQDEALRAELWQDWMIEHFPDGPAGEMFCVFIFSAEEADLWIDGESAVIGGDEL